LFGNIELPADLGTRSIKQGDLMAAAGMAV
jgi:hypothetical protein